LSARATPSVRRFLVGRRTGPAGPSTKAREKPMAACWSINATTSAPNSYERSGPPKLHIDHGPRSGPCSASPSRQHNAGTETSLRELGHGLPSQRYRDPAVTIERGDETWPLT